MSESKDGTENLGALRGSSAFAWMPYASVDWHNPVWLRAPGVDPVVMQWSFGLKRWVGKHFGMMGPIRIYWDLSEMEPSEWAPIDG